MSSIWECALTRPLPRCCCRPEPSRYCQDMFFSCTARKCSGDSAATQQKLHVGQCSWRPPVTWRSGDWTIWPSLRNESRPGLMVVQDVQRQNSANHSLTSVQVLSAESRSMWTVCEMSRVQVRERFERDGGRVYEFAAAEGVEVHPNGVSLVLPESSSRKTSAGNDAPAAGNGSTGTQKFW